MLLVIASNLQATLASADSCLKLDESKWNKVVKDKNYIETFKEFGDSNNDTSNVKCQGLI